MTSRNRNLIAPSNGYRFEGRSASWYGVSKALDFDSITCPENLVSVFKAMRWRSPTAPGLDDYTIRDFSTTEFGEIARVLSRQLRNGVWRHSASRPAFLTRSRGGRGRLIRIRNLVDRVVSTAVAVAVTNELEKHLSDHTFAYRPGRSSHHMHAVIAQVIEDGNYVVAQDDVRSAFSFLRVADAVNDFRRVLSARIAPVDRLVNLIRNILLGSNCSEVGIEQGDPLSPPTFNLRMHFCFGLSSQSTAHQNNSPLRFWYSDNAVYLCQSVSEGLRAVAVDGETLREAGFSFKGQNNYPLDLNRQGAVTEVLGLRLRLRNGRVKFDFKRNAFHELSIALQACSIRSNPVLVSKQVIAGWINEYGAVFESNGCERYLSDIRDTILEHHLDECSSSKWLRSQMEKACDTWNRIRVCSIGNHFGDTGSTIVAPQPEVR